MTTTKPVAKQTDQVILAQLKAMGFSDDYVETPRRLVISVEGREKTGKSHFGLTAPGPIVYLNVDIGTEGVVGKFQDKGKQVYLYDIRIPREANANVWQTLWVDFKYRVRKVYELKAGSVIWDSISYESPLVLKNKDGHVWVGTVEDFWLHEANSIVPCVTEKGEEVLDISKSGWRVANTVWNRDTLTRSNPWTAVKSIIRHPYAGKLLRVTTAGGTIRVTPNHSLARASGKGKGNDFIDAGGLGVGDELSLPMYVRTPSNLARIHDNCMLFVGSLDLAWLYGLFVAEGSAWNTRDSRFPDWSGVSMSIVNKDESLVDRAKSIIETEFHVAVFKNKDNVDGTWRIGSSDSRVSSLFRNLFYNSRKEKVIPMVILNAVGVVKDSFWEGYMAGDGHVNSSGTPEFDTTSTALAAGLLWMRRSASMNSRDVSVYTRQDKPTVTRVCFPQKAVGSRGRIRSIVEEDYDGLVYDLETENHAFCAGVGGVLCHNTASELYELARLAHFGRLTEVKPSDYAVVNNEWRDVLRIAYDSPMNTIFVHKTKAIWRVVPTSGGRSSLTKTNEFEMSGYSDMAYLVQVNLVMYREDTDNGPEFSAYIKDCRQNPYIAGQVLRGPMCDFGFLLSLVHDK